MTVTITPGWNTGDVNSRATQAVAVLDDAGVPRVLAPIAHGVRCFSAAGSVLWSYSGITNGFDVRDVVTADLFGTGHADCAIVAAGYYATTTDGKFAIVDASGNEIQKFTGNDFTTPPSRCYSIAVDGTDIYVGSDLGITKFAKSGSTWTQAWTATVGEIGQIKIADAGNGTRVYFTERTVGKIACYQTDGTEDWTYAISNTYVRDFAIAKLDPSKVGRQIAVGKQSGLLVLDKDGALSATIATSNVCTSVVAVDHDGDGVFDLYHADMGRQVRRYACTAADTYALQFSLDTAINSGQYGGLANFDLDEDGIDEVFIYTTDGHCLIYDATLTTQIQDLTIGHGQAGGYYAAYGFKNNGLLFPDLDGDGHADIVIAGSTGYVDTLTVSGATAATPTGQSVGSWATAGSATGSTPAVQQLVAPTGLLATPGVNQIDLSWDAVSAASGYDVERDGQIIAYDVVATTYVDSDAEPGVEYAYRVRAVR